MTFSALADDAGVLSPLPPCQPGSGGTARLGACLLLCSGRLSTERSSRRGAWQIIWRWPAARLLIARRHVWSLHSLGALLRDCASRLPPRLEWKNKLWWLGQSQGNQRRLCEFGATVLALAARSQSDFAREVASDSLESPCVPDKPKILTASAHRRRHRGSRCSSHRCLRQL
jgi:hypothetical protein